VREYKGNAYSICAADAKLPAFLVKKNLAEAVLRRGIRVGFVAGPDDHSGKPGAGIKGILRCSMDGLTAMRDYRLDRETLFQHLESRSVYATTGARILLDFSVNGKGMGEEISLPPNAPRAIRAEVHGQAPVSEVAVIREDPQKPVQVWRFDPPILDPGVLEWTDPEPLKSSTWYYLRVIQSDHHLAWSSPVWVDPDSLP